MKRSLFLLAGVAALAAISTALAQVNVVPQVGVITQFNTLKQTYHSVALSHVPAASATDIACITGSASKTIKIKEIMISGTAGTLVTAPFTLVNRTAVNTAGTASGTTANWANNVSKADSGNATHTAVLISYSANPTITDTSPTYVRSANVTLPVTTAGTSIRPIIWSFGDLVSQPYTLRGAAQQSCINLNAVSVSSGLLQLGIVWTEE